MSISAGPKVVTDNLVLYIDPNNKNSVNRVGVS